MLESTYSDLLSLEHLNIDRTSSQRTDGTSTSSTHTQAGGIHQRSEQVLNETFYLLKQPVLNLFKDYILIISIYAKLYFTNFVITNNE